MELHSQVAVPGWFGHLTQATGGQTDESIKPAFSERVICYLWSRLYKAHSSIFSPEGSRQ